MSNWKVSYFFAFCVAAFVICSSTEAAPLTRNDAARSVVMISGAVVPGEKPRPLGAGIVVGATLEQIQIATASHVVRSQRRYLPEIYVEFRSNPGQKIRATAIAHDEEKDVAVIVVSRKDVKELPLDRMIPTGMFADEIPQGISIIGFGEGAYWSGNEIPVSPNTVDSEYVELPSRIVVQGHSGGAAFNHGWRLVGMVLREGDGGAKVLRVHQLVKILKNFGVVQIFEPLENPMTGEVPDDWLSLFATVMTLFAATEANLANAMVSVGGELPPGVRASGVEGIELYIYDRQPDDTLLELYRSDAPFMSTGGNMIEIRVGDAAALVTCVQHPSVTGKGFVYEMADWKDTSPMPMLKMYQKQAGSEIAWAEKPDPCPTILAPRVTGKYDPRQSSAQRGTSTASPVTVDAPDIEVTYTAASSTSSQANWSVKFTYPRSLGRLITGTNASRSFDGKTYYPINDEIGERSHRFRVIGAAQANSLFVKYVQGDTTIGLYEFSVKFADIARQAFKQRALEPKNWVECSDNGMGGANKEIEDEIRRIKEENGGEVPSHMLRTLMILQESIQDLDSCMCGAWSMGMFYPGIKRVLVGPDSTNLRTVIELEEPNTRVLDGPVWPSAPASLVENIKLPEQGSDGVYVQLHFFDDSVSDVRRHNGCRGAP